MSPSTRAGVLTVSIVLGLLLMLPLAAFIAGTAGSYLAPGAFEPETVAQATRVVTPVLPSPEATREPTAGSTRTRPIGLLVTLREWNLGVEEADGWLYFELFPDLGAGETGLSVENAGIVEHSLWVIRTDREPDALRVVGNVAVLEGGDVVMAKLTGIGAGQRTERILYLESGRYLLICNVPAHYELGLAAALTID